MVTMGVERSWGRVYLALWAPTLLAELPLLHALRCFWPGGPAVSMPRAQVCPPHKQMPLYYSPIGKSKGLVQSVPEPRGRRQWDTLRSDFVVTLLITNPA